MIRFYEDKLKNMIKTPYFKFILVGVFLIIVSFMSDIIPATEFGAIVQTSYYFLAGLGFALLLGYGGLASLGSGAFIGIGSFALHYTYKYMSLPLILCIAIAMIISIIISLVFGFVSLRISGMYLAIVTMGLSQIVVEVIKNISQYASGTTAGFLVNPNKRPLEILGFALKAEHTLIFAAVFIVLGMIVIYNLMHSATGRALLSIKNSETAAQTMGIGLIKYRLLAFLISGVYGTLAGILSILYNRSANVNQMGLSFALNILAAVIIGGTKSIWGIMAGTFIIFGIDLAILQKLNLGNYSQIFNGILIIVVVMFYPGGISQLFLELKIKFKKLKRSMKESAHKDE